MTSIAPGMLDERQVDCPRAVCERRPSASFCRSRRLDALELIRVEDQFDSRLFREPFQ